MKMSSLIFGNGTNIVHWKPSPLTRGTFDILSTCLITLVLCVWTAVHLNVPRPADHWRPIWRKFGWLVLTLLAPELVAWTAWYVHAAARTGAMLVPVHLYSAMALTIIRNQRSEALSTMRFVNDAYSLPNPPTWAQSVARMVKNAALKAARLLTFLQQDLLKVNTSIGCFKRGLVLIPA